MAEKCEHAIIANATHTVTIESRKSVSIYGMLLALPRSASVPAQYAPVCQIRNSLVLWKESPPNEDS